MSVDSFGASGVFRVGDVMSRAWRLCAGNLLFFLLVPVAIYAIMIAVFVALGLTFFFAGWASGSAVVIGIGIVLAVIVVLSLTMLGQGVLLLGAFQRLRGQPIRVGDVLGRVLARFLPLIGLSILWSVAVVLVSVVAGFLFGAVAAAIGSIAIVLTPLIYVPSAVLLVIWAVIVPACIVEGLGPIGSMNRSASLTKGYRWRIFGILLLLGILYGVAAAVQFALGMYSQALSGLFALVWFVLWIAYWNCTVIMTYHDLRVAKEGIDTEQIASIFD
jgi:hypothetical protein